ncbi:hypothetical protein RF11_01576 [Thelohanellus kitauei]|uniref:Uncharacterized protein n=1 Tax=Thelohanellus kitauei TaxID=669202 RepID=A0A0C2IW11_THEKT|nr:hypothetical protein RF11_01576 [Thelohanellus kitauei]
MIVFRSEFENTYLFHIFELTLHIVFVRIIHGFVHEVFSPVYLETTFEILDQILSWRFDVTRDYFKYICFQESQVDFEPPASWSESIARFNLCTLVFYLLQSFSSSPQLCPIVRSVLLQYSSIRFRDIDYDYIDLHMSNFLINFSRVVPAACHIGDSSVLWCLCSVIRKFVETPIKITWGEKYTTKLLKIILENGDVFIHLINTISKELKGCCDDIYIDSANEFFSFVLKLRDFMTKYNVFMFNESKIFFQNLKQIGADLLEQDLIQPLGHLEVSSPKTRSIIDKFNSSDEDEHTFWMDDSAYIMIPELSLFIADKLVAHLKLVVNGFDGEKQLPDSHMFYNLNRLLNRRYIELLHVLWCELPPRHLFNFRNNELY